MTFVGVAMRRASALPSNTLAMACVEVDDALPRAMVRVLVADTNGVLRLGLRTLLESEPDITVVAEAADLTALLAAAAASRPDVILLDLGIPGLNGLAIPTELARAFRVVVLTGVEDATVVTRAVAEGAVSYLIHGQFPLTELPDIVRRAAVGQPYLTSSATAAVLDYFRRDVAIAIADGLTAREREVLDLVAAEMSNREIADRLSVSIKTVKNHLCRAFKQLDVTDRQAAALIWRNHCSTPMPPSGDGPRTGP